MTQLFDARELTINTITGEGLEKDGTSLSQIPTYVTGVPNGTEKVRYSGLLPELPTNSGAIFY